MKSEAGPGPEPTSEGGLVRALRMDWLGGDGPCADIVVSSRVRVARNLAGHRYPLMTSASDAEAVRDEVRRAVEASAYFADFRVVALERLTPIELHMLVEKHVESPLHVSMVQQGAKGRSLILGPNALLTGMVNEEDHLRLQSVVPGLQPEVAWDLLTRMDDALEQSLDYAFSDTLGYLSACPSNLGTAMRVSVMMHLPGLAIALGNNLDQVRNQVGSQVGLTMRGLYGEGTSVCGNMVQISNQISLGPTEEDLLGRLKGMASRIVEQEVSVRQQLRREFSPHLGDKVWRALGILRHVQMIEPGEALDLLSWVRLGVELEVLPPISRARLNELLISIRPATLQALMGEATDPIQANMMRARRIREELSEQA